MMRRRLQMSVSIGRSSQLAVWRHVCLQFLKNDFQFCHRKALGSNLLNTLPEASICCMASSSGRRSDDRDAEPRVFHTALSASFPL